jgi:hypothetical protein
MGGDGIPDNGCHVTCEVNLQTEIIDIHTQKCLLDTHSTVYVYTTSVYLKFRSLDTQLLNRKYYSHTTI